MIELFQCCTCKQKQERTLNNFCRNKNCADGLSVQCKMCAKKYREDHKKDCEFYPSSSKEYRKNYISKNRERINHLRRELYLKRQEKGREEARQNYRSHREERIQKMEEYYREHKLEIAARYKQYRVENREYINLKNRKRNLHLLGQHVTAADIKNLISNNSKCFYCKSKIIRGINLHLDHMVPLSRGGKHQIDNLQVSCAICNLKKGTKTAEEYLRKYGSR